MRSWPTSATGNWTTTEAVGVPIPAIDGTATSGPAPARDGRRRLEEAIADRLGSAREARWIVEDAGGDAGRAGELADRRATGEPLQYVLGRWPFRSLDLVVDRRVLIPRPETEQLVEVALAELGALSPSPGGGPGPVGVDLGTGSGAIALSLAVEGGPVAPGLVVWATDASADALDVARENLAGLAVRDPVAARRVRISGGRWFDALPPEMAGTIDLVVSNPPYVAESDLPGLDPTVRDWEPHRALVAAPGSSGVGGMADIEAVIAGAARWLRPSGALVVEIDPSQGAAALEVAGRAGFPQSRTRRDLAGRIRMVVARR
jgi:release factor glutamine methyltransferase